MIFFSEHLGVTFRWSEVDQSHLHDWYDDLPEGPLKASIVKVIRRDAKGSEAHHLTISCQHPFAEFAAGLEASKQAGDESQMTRALERLHAAFLIWARIWGASEDMMLDGEPARVSWMPVELTRNDPEEQSPEALALDEMNGRIGCCLSAIFAAEEPGGIGRCKYEGSNDLFMSAGVMLTGDIRVMLRRFPAAFPRDEAEAERFRENLVESTEFFLTLVRMAQRAGHRSTLMSRLLGLFAAFSDEHRSDLARWRRWEAIRCKDGSYFLSTEEMIRDDEYAKIDEAGEDLTNRLLAAMDGLEHEVAPMINSFLPDLPVPDTPLRHRIQDDEEEYL